MRVLTFQVGPDRLALPLSAIVAVVPRVPLYQPAGAPAWLAGLLHHRGRPVPVVDLHRLASAGTCPDALSSRIILVPAPGGGPADLLGLQAAQVADIRELPEETPRFTGGSAPGRPDLGSLLVEGGEIVRLLDVARLLPEAERRLLAAVAEAPP
jgi:chemotaxis-related protein WspB